jgi:hypothetical protein
MTSDLFFRFTKCILLITIGSAFILRGVPATAGTLSSTTIVNLPANEIELAPSGNLLYASVPSSGGVGVGNSITRIDLGTGSILDSTFIGSEPTSFGVSSDGSEMYVYLSGSDKIREFNPVTLTPGPQTTVWNNELIGDVAVVPGQPNTFVTSLLRSGSPMYVGIGVYHFDGTNFATNGAVGIAANHLQYSSDPSIFYATSGGTLAKVTLGAGDSLSAQYGPALGATDPAISLSGTSVASAAGRAADLTTFTNAGLFAGGPWTGVAADAAHNRVFLISGQTISIFDMTTFIKLDTLTIPQVGSAQAFDLTRYGANGLAFRTSQGQVFMIQSTSVPEPSSVVLALVGLVGLAYVVSRQKHQRD